MNQERKRSIALAAAVVAAALVGVLVVTLSGSRSSEPASTNPVVANRVTEERAGTAESVLSIGAFVVVIGACATAGLWAQRRRRRGEEAASGNAEGGDAAGIHIT